MSRFCGLRSRCRTFLRWQYARPRSSWNRNIWREENWKWVWCLYVSNIVRIYINDSKQHTHFPRSLKLLVNSDSDCLHLGSTNNITKVYLDVMNAHDVSTIIHVLLQIFFLQERNNVKTYILGTANVFMCTQCADTDQVLKHQRQALVSVDNVMKSDNICMF